MTSTRGRSGDPLWVSRSSPSEAAGARRDLPRGLGLAALLLILTLPPEIYPLAGVLSLIAASAALVALLFSAHAQANSGRMLPFIAMVWIPLVFSMTGTVSLGRTLDSLTVLLLLTFMYGCARWGVPWRELAIVILLAASFHVVWPAAQKIFLFKWDLAALAKLAVKDPEVVRLRLQSGRVFSTFMLPSHLGLFHAMAVPLVTHAAVTLRGRLRVWAAVLVPLEIIVLFMTLSYASVLALGGGIMAAMLWIPGRRPVGRRWVWIGAIVCGLAAAVVLVATQRHSPLLAENVYSSSIAMRVRNQTRALEMLWQRPVAGYGYGTFGLVYPEFMEAGDNPTQFAHNAFLQVGAEAGAFGLVSMLALALASVLLLGSLARHGSRERLLGRVLFVALAAFWIHNVFDFDWYLPSLAGLGFFLLGWADERAGSEPRPKPRRTAVRALAAALVIVVAFAGSYTAIRVAGARRELDRAFVAEAAGHGAEALTYAGRAAQRWPLGFKGWLERSRYAMAEPGGTGTSVAVDGFRRAVAAARTVPSAHYGLGLALLESGKRFSAYHALATASDLFPSSERYRTDRDKVKATLERIRSERDEQPLP